MAVKYRVYILTIILLILVNVIYHKQFFIEQSMKFKLRNETIVVTLSTTPYRIDKMQDTLQTILDQNIKVKGIYLSVPYTFKRDNIAYQIPQWLLDNNKITILRTEDYGPATKLLGLLEKTELPPETIIITLDDDIKYPRNTVLQLAYAAQQQPNTAIGIVGADIDYDQDGQVNTNSDLGYTKKLISKPKATVLKGYGGVAYRRKFFDQTIFEMDQLPQACIKSDDLYFSFYLAKHEIPRFQLRNKYINGCMIGWSLEIGNSKDALHLLEKPAVKHRACISYLKSNNPRVIF